MSILYLNHSAAWGGGTFYRAYHADRYLVRRGHSVTLLTISVNRRWGFQCEESEGVEIIHTPDLLSGVGRTGWDPWDTLNRIVHLRGQTWNTIHAWDSRPVVILPALYARQQSQETADKLVIDWCDWWGRGGIITERSQRDEKRANFDLSDSCACPAGAGPGGRGGRLGLGAGGHNDGDGGGGLCLSMMASVGCGGCRGQGEEE